MAGYHRRGVLAGHMVKALEDIRENLKAVHVVLELVDARLPRTSRNPQLGKLAGNKARLIVLNKADLVDEEGLRRWEAYFRAQGLHAVAVDAAGGRGIDRMLAAARAAVEAARSRGRGAATPARSPDGVQPRPVQPLRAMIVGIPNVGKSSLLNRLAGGARARTGARPGITRGKQWVRAGGLQLLDLPGVLPPFLRNREALRRLAIIAAVGPETVPSEEAALALLELLRARAPRQVELFYGLETEEGDPQDVLEGIGRRRGCLAAGGRVDYERTAELLLKDFRAGRLGRVTLEDPPAADGLEEPAGEDL